MAHPVEFPESNRALAAPDGKSADGCGSLPVHADGKEITISCWELSGDDLMEVLETKRVWVWVFAGGRSQPPIGISTKNPFQG